MNVWRVQKNLPLSVRQMLTGRELMLCSPFKDSAYVGCLHCTNRDHDFDRGRQWAMRLSLSMEMGWNGTLVSHLYSDEQRIDREGLSFDKVSHRLHFIQRHIQKDHDDRAPTLLCSSNQLKHPDRFKLIIHLQSNALLLFAKVRNTREHFLRFPRTKDYFGLLSATVLPNHWTKRLFVCCRCSSDWFVQFLYSTWTRSPVSLLECTLDETIH